MPIFSHLFFSIRSVVFSFSFAAPELGHRSNQRGGAEAVARAGWKHCAPMLMRTFV
jgi:hypothetical protein